MRVDSRGMVRVLQNIVDKRRGAKRLGTNASLQSMVKIDCMLLAVMAVSMNELTWEPDQPGNQICRGNLSCSHYWKVVQSRGAAAVISK